MLLVEMGFYQVGQAGIELLTSGDPPAWASESAGITGMSHCTVMSFNKALKYTFMHTDVVDSIYD